ALLTRRCTAASADHAWAHSYGDAPATPGRWGRSLGLEFKVATPYYACGLGGRSASQSAMRRVQCRRRLRHCTDECWQMHAHACICQVYHVREGRVKGG